MKTATSVTVRVIVLLALLVGVVSAQPSGSAARRTSPALTMDDLGNRNASAPASQHSAPQTEAAALLPASDLIVYVDAQQALRLLLPQVGSMAPAELLKMKRQLDEFMAKTGVDPLKISSVTIGVSFSGSASKATGAVIVEGIQPDMQKIAAALRSEKIVFKTLTYQGQPLLIGAPDSKALLKTKQPAAASGKAEEMALAPLSNGLVLGDPASVKSVLDAQAGARPAFANALHSEMLAQASPSAMIRFSAVIPDSLRQSLKQQDQSLAPFAAISQLGGSFAFDPSETGGMSLDLRARTTSAGEAAQLQTALSGLVALGKGFVGGEKDPLMQLFSQVLDEVQIHAQQSDVMLSLSVSRTTMNRFKELMTAPKRSVAENKAENK